MQLIQLLQTYCSIHPYLDGPRSKEHVRVLFLDKISTNLSEEKRQTLQAYFEDTWYYEEEASLWEDGLRFTECLFESTSMLVESHWRLI